MRNRASDGSPRHRRGWGWIDRPGFWLVAAGFVTVAGLIAAAAAVPAATSCAGLRVSVAADHPDDARVACRGAGEAIAFLAERGFEIREPVVVEVVETIDVYSGVSVLGIYDANADVVKVLARSAFSSGTVGDVVLGLPIDEALYASIFAHEVAHAVIFRNIGAKKLSPAAHEYLAYAVQLATLPTAYRERVLARFSGGGFSDLAQVSEIVLGFDPDRFAVKAYLHFRKLDDQDAVLRRLLAALPTSRAEWY